VSHPLTVVLLCRNRPGYAAQTIDSILAQTRKDFRFVLSDNSTDFRMRDLAASRYPQVEYRSWYPGTPLFEHFRNAMALVDTPYFVLFHDDDLMEPRFVEKVLAQFEAHPEAAAVATNGRRVDAEGRDWPGPDLLTDAAPVTVVTASLELAERHLAVDLGGVAPFCSYVYHRERIRGLCPDFSVCGYYCDTIFLFDVLERGPLVWINEPLMKVRDHGGNVSYACGSRDYKSFITLLRQRFGASIPEHYIDEYRCPRLLVTLKRRGRMPAAAMKYMARVIPGLMIRSRSFRKRVMRRMLARLQ
jgi:glycosyltransferase involved in cell wall biosynthesis